MSGVLVVGESLVDVVMRPGEEPVEHVGGSPANVALGLARLGRETHLLTSVGDDARGDRIRDHLAASGVVLVEGSQRPGTTSTARARLDEEGGATYEFDLAWRLPTTPLTPDPVAVHTGSIAAVLQPGAATVERIVRGVHHRSTVTYDPNLRPDLMGEPVAVRGHVESLVAAADVVKLSDEDAHWLDPGTDPEDLLATWLRLGPSVVVLTRGGEGAVALCADGRVEVPSAGVRVVDTVGAGDSFMSGLLDGLWRIDLLGGPRREALRAISAAQLTGVLEHAARLAGITVSRPGADPPTLADLA